MQILVLRREIGGFDYKSSNLEVAEWALFLFFFHNFMLRSLITYPITNLPPHLSILFSIMYFLFYDYSNIINYAFLFCYC